ncbi:hypothetical protein KP509_22G037500 [Ceratopteris richardii]|uniref:Uncharacterized protein n=1 Tax=Ceratopteris richardii TaxID=49495 RepID=A0A8T2S538_CERRI|nr:hypothetical protein KP509_22G037500 [Ceratopteris richardii]
MSPMSVCILARSMSRNKPLFCLAPWILHSREICCKRLPSSDIRSGSSGEKIIVTVDASEVVEESPCAFFGRVVESSPVSKMSSTFVSTCGEVVCLFLLKRLFFLRLHM